MPTESRGVALPCLAGALAVLGISGIAGCRPAPEHPRVFAAKLPDSELVLGVREGLIADYPCQTCHAHVASQGASTTAGPRQHSVHVAHFAGAESCDVCHDPSDRDRLRLLTGHSVGFDDAHRQCGQCHGEKLRDWNIGAHGKHVGGWAGIKHRLVCSDCHDPHAPARPLVTAAPAPPFPRFGIPKSGDR